MLTPLRPSYHKCIVKSSLATVLQPERCSELHFVSDRQPSLDGPRASQFSPRGDFLQGLSIAASHPAISRDRNALRLRGSYSGCASFCPLRTSSAASRAAAWFWAAWVRFTTSPTNCGPNGNVSFLQSMYRADLRSTINT